MCPRSKGSRNWKAGAWGRNNIGDVFRPCQNHNSCRTLYKILRLIPRSISVHPRGCGERITTSIEPSCGSGSSPRERGTQRWWSTLGLSHRFIPAGAGNANGAVRFSFPSTVHPRGCGERDIQVDEYSRVFGSSPRVRGTPLCQVPGPD